VSEATSDSLIHARGLVKEFGDFRAVDAIDFDLRRGEAFGFLGPNGAGKTSTMRMIGCVSPVTDGTLRVFGLDPAKDGVTIRGRLGVVPQLDTLDMELTVRENVLIYGRYFGLPRKELRTRVEELLDFVQLTERADSKVEPLSGGMKRRLTIARSLVNDPEVMLLDEPTTGLDPQARHVVWDRLYRLKQSGVTLVLTTHYMDEAEQLADRVAIMARGEIVALGTAEELRSRRTETNVRFRLPSDAPPLPSTVPAGPPDAEGHRAAATGDATRLLYELTRWAIDHHVQLLDVSVSRASLEDVYLEITVTQPTQDREAAS